MSDYAFLLCLITLRFVRVNQHVRSLPLFPGRSGLSVLVIWPFCTSKVKKTLIVAMLTVHTTNKQFLWEPVSAAFRKGEAVLRLL